ncbi:MAG TPA: error-prone DNA polymerase [Acidobacteriota bacterium]|nr:error-prone DNA polymerase [Acidobacteriota bacterium]
MYAQSAFSFLQASSTPEQLAGQAARLGYEALALADCDGVYGAPRFFKACRRQGVRPLVGSLVTLRLDEMEGRTCSLPLLVENRQGYRNLCRLVTRLKMRAGKGEGDAGLHEVAEFAGGLTALTGGSEGPLHTALAQGGRCAARRLLDRLSAVFPKQRLYLELQRHQCRRQEIVNQEVIDLSRSLKLPLMASGGVRCARRQDRPLLDVLTCIRHRTTLEAAGRKLAPNAQSYLKPPEEMKKLFADCPQAWRNALELGEKLDFTLDNLGYRFPDFLAPAGETPTSYLRKLTEQEARKRYRPYHQRARRQIARELDLIEKLDLAGYFLIVWDIVRYCRRRDILVQGRGSAANSAVCYSLGITAVDPVGMDLLFERFLSEERGEWPDIDLDLPSGDRREEVIQHVYQRYGRRGAAMTANVITYRGKSAARQVGKALGFPEETLGKLSRLMSVFHEKVEEEERQKRFLEAGIPLDERRAQCFFHLWKQIQNLPRHLGQHSGGLVLAQGALDDVVPLENATMPGRHVIQWDKEDCADLGIIKVDLLGLGMMSALQDAIRLIEQRGGEIDLAHLPQNDPKTYDLLQKADTVGVFQVESRAQMATLPRLKPTCFYDLVVEVALIRPGPVVGQMVHPYLRRRNGEEPVSYPHPSLEPILKRTLGVPLFQEQLMKIAMTAAGFTGGQAEQLRRAMGFKRSTEAMDELEDDLLRGMARRGIRGQAAEEILRYVKSFALYGFPESHSASFALLAYASAYMKAHFPAEFYAALLNNQPMGFYHPATLVKDAQHRGQRVRPVDVQRSHCLCSVEEDGSLRLGLIYASGLRRQKAQDIEAERRRRPFASLDDLRRRCSLQRKEMAVLAQIGALNSLGMKRRQALWQVEKACRPGGPLFKKQEAAEAPESSPLREMDASERLQADYRGSGLTIGPHPLALRRKELSSQGIVQASGLAKLRHGSWVKVAGMVIVRQRPMTAKGFLFMSLEDETGISNIVVTPRLFEEQRLTLLGNSCLIVEGRLQSRHNVISVKAARFQPFDPRTPRTRSHDFH